MNSLEEIARRQEIPVVIVLKTTEGEPYDTAFAAARRHAFQVVTVGPYFAAHARSRNLQADRAGWADAFWLSRRDPHPNDLGHRLIAEVLLEAVAPLVPARPSLSDGETPGVH